MWSCGGTTRKISSHVSAGVRTVTVSLLRGRVDTFCPSPGDLGNELHWPLQKASIFRWLWACCVYRFTRAMWLLPRSSWALLARGLKSQGFETYLMMTTENSLSRHGANIRISSKTSRPSQFRSLFCLLQYGQSWPATPFAVPG